MTRQNPRNSISPSVSPPGSHLDPSTKERLQNLAQETPNYYYILSLPQPDVEKSYPSDIIRAYNETLAHLDIDSSRLQSRSHSFGIPDAENETLSTANAQLPQSTRILGQHSILSGSGAGSREQTPTVLDLLPDVDAATIKTVEKIIEAWEILGSQDLKVFYDECLFSNSATEKSKEFRREEEEEEEKMDGVLEWVEREKKKALGLYVHRHISMLSRHKAQVERYAETREMALRTEMVFGEGQDQSLPQMDDDLEGNEAERGQGKWKGEHSSSEVDFGKFIKLEPVTP